MFVQSREIYHSVSADITNLKQLSKTIGNCSDFTSWKGALNSMAGSYRAIFENKENSSWYLKLLLNFRILLNFNNLSAYAAITTFVDNTMQPATSLEGYKKGMAVCVSQYETEARAAHKNIKNMLGYTAMCGAKAAIKQISNKWNEPAAPAAKQRWVTPSAPAVEEKPTNSTECIFRCRRN